MAPSLAHASVAATVSGAIGRKIPTASPVADAERPAGPFASRSAIARSSA